MTTHIIPIDDLMVNHESESCPCNPKIDREFNEYSVDLTTLNS